MTHSVPTRRSSDLGVRVCKLFDPLQPYEISYYNPPAHTGKGLSLQHSLHAWIGGLLPPISDLYTSDSGASADTVATDARYVGGFVAALPRSEEHTSELQSLMRISYAVFCLKKNKYTYTQVPHNPLTEQHYLHHTQLSYNTNNHAQQFCTSRLLIY